MELDEQGNPIIPEDLKNKPQTEWTFEDWERSGGSGRAVRDPVGDVVTAGLAYGATKAITPIAKILGPAGIIDAGINIVTGESDTAFEKKLELIKPAKVGVKATRLLLEKIFDQRVSPEDLPPLNLAESHKRHPQITKLSDLKKQARNRRILDETSIDDGYIEEIVEHGDDVIYPEGSIEANIQANTQAMASDYSYRKGRPLKNPIWDNLSPKVQKQFTDAGIDSDNAKFFIENWTREVGATVEGFPFTDATFEFMKGELLPKILEDMKGIDLSDGLQLDHIAQLRAMTPFYKGRNLKQSNKIRRILIQEGIFGGHNPKNLKYLPTDVHTVKTRFWEQQVGKDGSKFFKGRKMRTYADIEKAAKEMKEFINRSNDIVEKVSAQYRFMRKKNITAAELDKILERVDLNFGIYNLKEVRVLIKEIKLDDLKRSEKGIDLLDEAIEAQTAKDSPLPYRYEDELPPTRKPVRSRKKQLDKNLRKETDKDTGQFDFLDDLFP